MDEKRIFMKKKKKAWSYELFVFRYLYFAVAWSSEPSDLFLLSQVPQGKEQNKG